MPSPEIGRQRRDHQPDSSQSQPAAPAGSADPCSPLQRDRAAVWAEHSAAEPSALQDDPADLPALFDAVAARWPDAKALVCRTGEATFRELNRSSRALAAMLQAHGAAHGEIVAFRMTAGAAARHRILFLATQIAAYRLGCALLPLAQQHPPAQTRAQIEALGARFVIDATAALDDLPGWSAGAHRERITDFGDAVLTVRRHVVAGQELPAGTTVALASGGPTGKPRGILLSAALLVGLLRGRV